MKVTESQFTVGKTKQGAAYQRAPSPDLQPIAQGLSSMASSFAQLQAEAKAKQDQMKRFKATSALVDFNTKVTLEQEELAKNSPPDDTDFAGKAVDTYLDREAEFLKTLPPDMQEEFTMRVADTRARVTIGAHEYQDKQLTGYYTNEVEKKNGVAAGELAQDPDALDKWRENQYRMIDEADISVSAKVALKQKTDEYLEKSSYRAKVRKNRLEDAQYSNELSTAARQVQSEYGFDPLDIMTAISYETGGKFSTSIRGGAGNRHIGLIQFGPEEAKKYGVYQGQPVGEQMRAVAEYLKDRGFRPGMSFAQLYATINGGNPGALNASDANNGGMPGTVLDKVNSPQMAEHRAKALQMMDGKYIIPDDVDEDPRYANVTYEDRMAARADSNTEVNALLAQMEQERKARSAAFNNELYNGLYAGQYGRKDIEDAIAAGRLQDYEDRKKAFDIIEKREKDVNDLADFVRYVQEGRVLDPTDDKNKKGMNLLLGDEGQKALNNRDEAYVQQFLVPTFAKTQMIPPDAVSILGALLNSEDPRQMIYAAKALTDLEQQNPNAFVGQVNETIRKRADRWEALKGVLPEPELIKVLQGPKTQQERNELRTLREEGEKMLLSKDTKIKFESLQDEFGGAELPQGIKGRAMESEWRALFAENYAATGGNAEAALKLTNKHLKNIWDVTGIDGRQTIMRYPPEKTTPYPVAGSFEWQTRQVRGEAGLVDGEDVLIISDLQTEQEVNNGLPASYLVYKVKDGVITPVMDDVVSSPPTGPGASSSRTVIRREPYRHVFKPSAKDTEQNDLAATITQKKTELQYYEKIVRDSEIYGRMVSKEAEKKMIPPETVSNIERLKTEIAELEGTNEVKQVETATQYETPAMKEMKLLKQRFDPINEELMNFTGQAEEFPRIKEWEELYDRINKLEIISREEVRARRQKMGVE